MRAIPLINEQFYHVYNRGVDKRRIFNDKADYERFVLGAYHFNDSEITSNIRRLSVQSSVLNNMNTRDTLVDIVAWCLMPNHIHMILRQLKDGGISKFMQRLMCGYTKYFNKRYERSGILLEGAFKAKLISNDTYLTHSVRYVHLNPVSLIFPGWEASGIQNWSAAIEFLDTYKWSSHIDYRGKSNFPELINKKWLPEYPELNNKYVNFLQSWLMKDLMFKTEL